MTSWSSRARVTRPIKYSAQRRCRSTSVRCSRTTGTMTTCLNDQFVRAALALPGSTPRSYSAVVNDTRRLPPGALFVALVGENHDGHDHLLSAGLREPSRRGAARYTNSRGIVLYEVADALHALGDLAAAHRQRIAGPVIAITGQNGKTSTKEMVAAVLGTSWRTHRTRENLNNLVGVPTTILEAPETRFAGG